MREFFFKDKQTKESYRGIHPKDDVNCLPFDYFRYGHAEVTSRAFQDFLKIKCPIPIPDSLVLEFMLQQTDDLIAEMLKNSTPKPEIHQLLSAETLSYKDQNKLLDGITLGPSDILWLNKEAQEMGYLLDIYHEEKYPIKFNEKQMPVVFHEEKDGTIKQMGTTDMTEGEMRAFLEQRKVIQARIYHKDDIWHCFYFTFKGLSGLERGLMGSQPHYHYLSDKSGISWDELIRRIKTCDMPTSKVHIIINR
jgi:hypothetical protein